MSDDVKKGIVINDGAKRGVEVIAEPATIRVFVNVLEIVAETHLPQMRLPSEIQLPKDVVTKNVFNQKPLENSTKYIQCGGVETKVVIDVEVLRNAKDISIENTDKLTIFDYAVFCAVATCYLDNTLEFSRSRIHKLLTADYKTKLTKIAEQNIVESIEKMRKIDVTIDYTPEAIKCNFVMPGGVAIIKNYMLPLKELILSYRGERTIRGYKFIDIPPLVQYALVKNQIAKIPKEDLSVPSVNKTEKNISILFYLVTRVIEMRENQKLENRINLKRLYDAVGAKNKVECERVRKVAEEILTYWKERNSFGLKGFSFVRHQKGFTSIEIDLAHRGVRG
ncbi:MAG: hypothetical protein QXV35_06120 [Archaeoglobaceae archaeon]